MNHLIKKKKKKASYLLIDFFIILFVSFLYSFPKLQVTHGSLEINVYVLIPLNKW